MSLNHPAKDQLIAFGQGKLAAEESSSVEQHLEVCRECCETLLDLKDDTFVGLVKIAQPSDELRVARPEPQAKGVAAATESSSTSHALPDGQDVPPTIDRIEPAATVLIQSGDPIRADELPIELRDHPRYHIVELIGRGGMGNVYRAEHRLMNRAVAIKLINSQLMQHPHAVERFRREVQAAAKLSHPNIVAAYDAEQAGNAHFLVMEFVEGTDLASVVKHRGPMSVAEACECIRQAAAGLQHAHEKGMVHRDIKPHNLMLAAGGQVRILDFGLAGFAETATADSISRNALASGLESEPVSNVDAGEPDASAFRLISTTAHLTTVGSVMGTPDYMAPEQAADAHSADIRADIYSLGCTLHFLLTGQPPFEADNVLMKLKAHAQERPPSLTTLRKDVPVEFAKVVARMLAKNPAERFQTPAAVAEALTPFAKPAASPPKRRVRTLVAALWMSVAALLAGVIFVQTDKGRIEIRWEVDDVKVSIQQGGKEIAVIDMQSGSKVDWYPSGKYDIVLKGDRNDIEIHNDSFKLRRWGKEIVTLKPATNGLATPEAQSVAADRKAAEYVLSIGGTVRITQNGEERQIVAGGDVTLPREPLELTYVSLVGNQNVTDEGLAVFKDCTRLTSLYLQSTPVGSAGMGHFQKCKRLKFLDLGSTRVSDAGLAAFKNCKNLLSLNLGATHVTDAGLANFKDCRELRTLYFYNAPNVNDVGMSYFKNCPNLMLLHLHGTKVTDIGLVNFKDCSRITYLQLGKVPVGDAGLSNFANCKNLRVVCLEATQVTDAGLATFKDCRDLEHLALNDTKVSDAGLGFIKDCKHLIAFHAPRTNVTEELIDDLKTALPRCKIEWNNQVIEPKVKRISDQDAAKWVLSLGGTVRAAGVDQAIQYLADLPEWPAITSIDLAGNQEVTDAGLAYLKDARHLARLDLSGTPLTNAGLKNLAACLELEHIHVGNTKVDAAGAKQLSDMLPNCKIAWETDQGQAIVAALSDEEKTVLKAAEAFLSVADEGDFDKLYDIGANLAKKQATREQVVPLYRQIRDTAGKVEKRSLRRVQLIDKFLGLPPGRYAAVQYASDFEKHKGLWETVMLNVDDDGQWRANTYAATVQPLPLPEPKKEPAAGEKVQQPTAPTQTLAEPKVFKRLEPDEQLVTVEGVTHEDGGWKIESSGARTVVLMDILKPDVMNCGLRALATIKTQDLTAEVRLEFRVATQPEHSYSYSVVAWPLNDKPGWSSYDLPFPMVGEKRPASMQLVLSFKGRGTVWVKDVALWKEPMNVFLLRNRDLPPRPKVATGINLLYDSSFEATPPGGRMDFWTGVIGVGPPQYRWDVVTGGRTDKHSLRITTTGTRGVVRSNQFSVDRTKRYALKGWVKFEGDKDARAVISFNYVQNVKTLGTPDLVGITADQPGWHLLEKTDTLELHPETNNLFAACHVEGKGTAWFDDLQLIAYDRDKLPADFEATHGKHNPPLAPAKLVVLAPQIPLGENLITDPSLEETAIGQKYPLGWGTGNVNPPNSFKHQVVEGGRTGQRGWLIEGNGQFAVIPTNRPPAHPAYRYAATAWVRIESGSAQIKLLYFDGQGQYIGENRGNVSIQQDGWHKLTMVDDLKSYPEARSLSLALTMTGAGKVVFDDLELLAFDASKLPEKFEATYGAASHSADVFDRWVGRWESTTTYAPTAATPEERVIKGETIVSKVLGDRFLLWQWSSDDGQSQYLTLLCFDNNIQSYRIWLFGSGGEVFERTGQWNAASQTLTLQVKPSSPGVTGMSTDRFVSQDRIESTLLVKGSGGQVTRDMRATWIRKSKTVEDEIALADGPRADISELAVLQKMVGRWSVRQTIKPCIAFPNGDQATGTEHNAWVLGGRFFLNRAYDDQQRLTALALQTYDPVEKTYQHWHFAKDVFGGQWRITWDASSRAFHWRAIDMPPGWIGTGFNRWINDDTFDNQALIKDEKGRTIFDSHQDKRRKK